MTMARFAVFVALLALTKVQGYGWGGYQQGVYHQPQQYTQHMYEIQQYPGQEIQIELPEDAYDIEIVKLDTSDADGAIEQVTQSLEASYRAVVEEIEEAHGDSIEASQLARQNLENLAAQVQSSVCNMGLAEIQEALACAGNPAYFQSCASEILNGGLDVAQGYLDTAYQCILEADNCRQQASDFANAQIDSIYQRGQELLDFYCQSLNACAYNPYGQCGQQYQDLQVLCQDQATAFNSVLTPLSAAEDTHINSLNLCLAAATEAQSCLRDEIVEQVQFCNY